MLPSSQSRMALSCAIWKRLRSSRQRWTRCAPGPGPWRSAVRHGLDALQRRYRRPDGLYRTLCDDSGAPLDERAFLYDQAFLLLALATAAKAGVEPRRCAREALQLRAILEETYA